MNTNIMALHNIGSFGRHPSSVDFLSFFSNLCRNGRFLLQSSHKILAPSVLSDCEEALNQGSTSAAEVFISLRSKSILHLFAAIGRFLGLEVILFSLLLSFLFLPFSRLREQLDGLPIGFLLGIYPYRSR